MAGYLVFRKLRDARPLRYDRWLAPAVMLGGGALMIGAMWLVSTRNGLQDGAMTGAAWMIATLAGMLFVGAQTFGALLTVRSIRIPETHSASDASESKGTEP